MDGGRLSPDADERATEIKRRGNATPPCNERVFRCMGIGTKAVFVPERMERKGFSFRSESNEKPQPSMRAKTPGHTCIQYGEALGAQARMPSKARRLSSVSLFHYAAGETAFSLMDLMTVTNAICCSVLNICMND